MIFPNHSFNSSEYYVNKYNLERGMNMSTIYPLTIPTSMCSPITEQPELARAYIPFQEYREHFEPEEALDRGTAFPELYRPYVKCEK